MIVCDFCQYRRQDDLCHLGMKIPKAMGCREFGPSLDKFCSESKDFVGHAQIVQMATFFGFKGSEMRKINLMASREETAKLAGVK